MFNMLPKLYDCSDCFIRNLKKIYDKYPTKEGNVKCKKLVLKVHLQFVFYYREVRLQTHKQRDHCKRIISRLSQKLLNFTSVLYLLKIIIMAAKVM